MTSNTFRSYVTHEMFSLCAHNLVTWVCTAMIGYKSFQRMYRCCQGWMAWNFHQNLVQTTKERWVWERICVFTGT